MGLRSVCLLPIFVLIQVHTIPPEACFANFRWDDCGSSPVPVMYYWKPGSRCEVGQWRGCLPNPNMFNDEYECVSTCIFAARAQPDDYHSIHENEIEGNTEVTTEVATESGNATEIASESTGSGSQATELGPKSTGTGSQSNGAGGGNATATVPGGGGGGNATVADGKATDAGGAANSTAGGGAATTAAGAAATTAGGAAATTAGGGATTAAAAR